MRWLAAAGAACPQAQLTPDVHLQEVSVLKLLHLTLKGAVFCVSHARCAPLFFFQSQKGNESNLGAVDFYPGNGTFDLMYYPYYGKMTHVRSDAGIFASLGRRGQRLLHRVQMCFLAILGRCRQERGHGHWDYSALFLSPANHRKPLGTPVPSCQQWEWLHLSSGDPEKDSTLAFSQGAREDRG